MAMDVLEPLAVARLCANRVQQGYWWWPPGGRPRRRDQVLWNNHRSKPLGSVGLSSGVGSDRGYDRCRDIHWLCEKGQLGNALDGLRSLEHEGAVPSVETFSHLLQLCIRRKALAEARKVYAHIVRAGLELNTCLGEVMVSTFVKCGSVADALQVFHRLSARSVFLWTTIICGLSDSGKGEQALRMYKQMQEDGVQPNRHTFLGALKACSSLADLEKGRAIHADIVRDRYGCDLFVSSCLVHMYASCGSILEARDVFDRMAQRNVVSWNSMIQGHVEQDQGEEALNLYDRMQTEGVTPNSRTFVSLLKACSSLASREAGRFLDGQLVKSESLQRGQAIYSEAVVRGFTGDIFIGNTVLDMYSKCGSILNARHVFDTMSRRDVVSWNAMISGYAQHQRGQEAFHLYLQMQEEGIQPDEWTFVGMLQACSSLAVTEAATFQNGQAIKLESLEKGKALYAEILRRGYKTNLFVQNTLIDMFSDCGSLVDARDIFDKAEQRNLVTWNAMISGYARQENGHQALHLYAKMQVEGMRPNENTFLSLLRACSSTGALCSCFRVHHDILTCGFQENLEVASALIHAYGKCGSMVDAQVVFESIHQPDVFAWNTLIAGYARGGDCSMCLQCFEKMQVAGLNPDSVTFISLLSACSHAGLVDEGLMFFNSMSRDYGIPSGIAHYSSVVDLLGRAGLLTQAEELLLRAPFHPDLGMWLALLGACRKYSHVAIGRRAFEQSVSLEPRHAAAYVLMSNIYAHAGMWEDANEVDGMRWKVGAENKSGQSWLEHGQEVQMFKAADSRQPHWEEAYAKLKELYLQMYVERAQFA